MSIKHLVRLVHSQLREVAKRVLRSPHWHTIEKRWKAAHPACEGCGTLKHVQVHHCLPFNDKPEDELMDGTGIPPATPGPCNLVSACMSENECHLRIAHGGNFKFYNPNVRRDLERARAHPDARIVIEKLALSNRLKNG